MVGYGTFERTIAAHGRRGARSRPGWRAKQFSAADVYAGSQIDWPMQFGMLEPTPALTDYITRLRARPGYVRAQEIDG